MRYIYQNANWPKFYWNIDSILPILLKTKQSQGEIIGKMKMVGFDSQSQAMLTSVTQTILTSSEIEGEKLNLEQVRSSISRKLGLETAGEINIPRDIDGIVEATLDAVKNYNKPLTKERLIGWHAAMFPTGYSGLYKIETGKYRDDKLGPMQVVSGVYGIEKVHYEAPPASILEKEMKKFLSYVNSFNEADNIIKAGISHLWFVILHPFDDGNGRLARIITDMLLARSDNCSMRFYSMSAEIKKKRKDYYKILEETQKGSLDITNWLCWFLETLNKAIENSSVIFDNILSKTNFWQKNNNLNLNERQKKIINLLFDGFEGKLTSTKWAKICKCSQDTATNDINELIKFGILEKHGQARATFYDLLNKG